MGTISVTNFTGALEGVADTDYRLIGAGALVSSPWNRLAVDANTVALWRMDEPAWDGTPGEVVDASGSGYHGTAYASANTAAGALERYGDVSGSKYVLTNAIPFPNNTYTFEAWVLPLATTVQGRTIASAGTNNLGLTKSTFSAGTYRYTCHQATAIEFTPTEGVWQHWTLMQSGRAMDGGKLSVHVNGVLAKSGNSANYNTTSVALAFGAYITGSSLSDVYFDDARLSKVLRQSQSANFTAPTMLSAASLRTSASAVDSGSAGSTWSQLVTTVAAVTGDETYAVYIYPSESATVPAAGSGLWQLVGAGYTTGQTLSISGTGRYCHTKIVTGASTGIGQYAVELDGLQWTYSLSSSSGIRRYNPHYLIGRNPGVM